MGRRKESSDEERVWNFLLAVGDHPWAPSGLIQVYGGLKTREYNCVAQPLALQQGLVERATVPAGRRAARRFGLTPAGAALLGQAYAPAFLRAALLTAVKRGPVHRLVEEWLYSPGLVWAISPYVLATAHLKPPSQKHRYRNRTKLEDVQDKAYRTLRLDGLACVKFSSREYLNVAILIDPGEIHLGWFYHQFRSAHAWSRRDEFHDRLATFPTFVVITTTEQRRNQLVNLWRESATWRSLPQELRITTWAALRQPARQRHWWDERGLPTSLWGGTVPFKQPSIKPLSNHSGWWGAYAANEYAAAYPLSAPIALERKKPSVLDWATTSKHRSASLLRDHLSLSQRGRVYLHRIGRYPLLSPEELATVFSQTIKNVQCAVDELESHGLIAHPASDEAGYALTGQGLALHAAQLGYSPTEYAKLRRWPIRLVEKQPVYSVDRLMACREHTRLVIEFFVGLRRHGTHARTQLLNWDYVQCLQDSPFPDSSQKSRMRAAHTRIIPDAVGMVRTFDETGARDADTDFWLEIDRGTERGQALLNKFIRYHRIPGRWTGSGYFKPRLLLVLDPASEVRMQTLCRRLRSLNTYYRIPLDVRLTHVGLLRTGSRGKLDPTQRVWRTVESDQMCYAFDDP